MNCKVAEVGVRRRIYLDSIEQLPDFKGLKLVARFIHIDSDGTFMGVQYALYFPAATFTVETDNEQDLRAVFDYLDQKIKAAGVNPKFTTGTLQNFDGEESETFT